MEEYEIIEKSELEHGDKIIVLNADNAPWVLEIDYYDENSDLIVLKEGWDIAWDQATIARIPN